jgi:Family of unknown function (DUF5662)
MGRYWQYGKYVIRHKWFVLLAGWGLAVPLWQLILHDWTKFLPGEWFCYARHFYNPDGSRKINVDDLAFDLGWNYHQKRNKHHWQWWVLWKDTGGYDCLEIPARHRLEMLADWMGAGRALGFPDTKGWYLKNYHNIQLHPDTRTAVNADLGVTDTERQVLNI